MKPTLLLLLLVFMVSCGTDDDDSGVSDIQEQGQQEDEGEYQGENVVIVNNTVENNVKAITNIRVEGDTIITRVAVNNAPQSVRHRQDIHHGRRCPTLADDTNQDGFVDNQETQAVVGPVLIPLDENIESQESGANLYPVANSLGSYVYSEEASLSLLLADLTGPDLDPTDEFGKLPPEENLNLEGRVVLIYGVSSSEPLPPTVQDGAEQLPICCTVIERDGGTVTGGTAGGVTTGGTAGGVTTGGTAGGVTTGGTAGGVTTGGTAGGVTTGGAAGGVTTGGAAGGVTTGGVTTGGAAGGVTTGGVTAGGVTTGGAVDGTTTGT